MNYKIVFYGKGIKVKEFEFESRKDFEKLLIKVMSLEEKKLKKEEGKNS